MDRSSLNGLCRIDGVFRATKLTDKGEWAYSYPLVLAQMVDRMGEYPGTRASTYAEIQIAPTEQGT